MPITLQTVYTLTPQLFMKIEKQQKTRSSINITYTNMQTIMPLVKYQNLNSPAGDYKIEKF